MAKLSENDLRTAAVELLYRRGWSHDRLATIWYDPKERSAHHSFEEAVRLESDRSSRERSERRRVTVDREYYAAVTRAVRYSSIALQPGVHENTVPPDVPADDDMKARVALLVVENGKTWDGIIPQVPGGCAPALTREELEL